MTVQITSHFHSTLRHRGFLDRKDQKLENTDGDDIYTVISVPITNQIAVW